MKEFGIHGQHMLLKDWLSTSSSHRVLSAEAALLTLPLLHEKFFQQRAGWRDVPHPCDSSGRELEP